MFNLFNKPKSTETLAKELYNLGKDLKIITDEPFDTFISGDEISKINEYEKEVFKVNPKSKNIREEQLAFKLIYLAEKKSMAFSVDWKWSPEDIIFNIKKFIINDLNIKLNSEDYSKETDNYNVSLLINGENENHTIPYGEPYKLISIINTHLPDRLKSKEFIEFDTGGDSYGYLLIDKSLINLAKSNTFLNIRNP